LVVCWQTGALLTGDGGENIREQDDAVGLEGAPGLQGHLHRDVRILCRGRGRQRRRRRGQAEESRERKKG
jgi:hypothetical protein